MDLEGILLFFSIDLFSIIGQILFNHKNYMAGGLNMTTGTFFPDNFLVIFCQRSSRLQITHNKQ